VTGVPTPRSLIAVPGVVLATGFFAALQLLASLLDSTGRASDAIARAWARAIARVCGLSVKARGAEGVPADRTCVIVCNHQSHLDTIALLLTSPVPMRMLAKASLFRIPFLGWSMARMGHVPIARERADAAVLLRLRVAVERLIRRGQSVVVFAEGSRGEGDDLRPFKKGAFHLARTFGLPIVPVAIDGTGKVLPARTLRFRGGPARVTYLAPIEPTGGDGADREVDDLLAETRARIAAALG
jgi:1-acyl-sn-glycerol-3-phosphate acyltransferase